VGTTDGFLVSLKNFRQFQIDLPSRQVTIGSGFSLREVNQLLFSHGLALPSLGSIDQQNIVGALTTGTHGASPHYGNVASFVIALEIIDGTGRVWQVSAKKYPDIFYAALVSLGSLGIITQLTIQAVPRFFLKESRRWCSLEQIRQESDWQKYYFYRLFWFPHSNRVQKQTMQKQDSLAAPISIYRQFLWATRTSLFSRRIGQLGRSDYVMCNSPWWTKLQGIFFRRPSFQVFGPEYAISAVHFWDFLDQFKSILQTFPEAQKSPVEIRFTKADNAFLSPAYQRDTCYFQVYLSRFLFANVSRWYDCAKACENLGKSFQARHHWAKNYLYTAKDFSQVYPAWNQFHKIRRDLDPRGIFHNSFTKRCLGDLA
jgi:L-gulonolactone oxidase